MIPKFPKFKSLEWSDRAEFEAYSKDLAPHSDFNFISVWAWDVNGSMKLSKLNDNLVILFNDYTTDNHYLSFAGKTKLTETARQLIHFSKEKYGVSILKYVPEEIANQIAHMDLDIIVDNDNCDYIVSVEDFAESHKLTGASGKAGQQCRQFINRYPEHQVKVCPITETNNDELRKLFQIWADNKCLNVNELIEYKAFERYLQLTDDNIRILNIYNQEKLMAFSTIEFLSKEYATTDFMKYNSNCGAMNQILLWKVSKYLHNEEINYLNLQVDMGNPALKGVKHKCNPGFVLRRFIVEPNNNVLNYNLI